MSNFFYDGQIRRFLLQFIRIMSNFQVEYGKEDDGTQVLKRVPVKYGDSSRQASQILNNASENTIAGCVPMISVYISDLKYDRPRVQEPYFVSNMTIRQREYNPETGTYGHGAGNAFTVERLMPVPYVLSLKADIWTSNLTQKLQLIEQVTVLFNPSLEIQNTDNYIDWTSLSAIEMTDLVFSSRTIPVGTEEPIDITTLSFDLPIWISAPAKVKKWGVIQKVIGSMYGDTETTLEDYGFDENSLLGVRNFITPLNYGIILLNSEAQLIKYHEPAKPIDEFQDPYHVGGTAQNWKTLLDTYGKINEGTSQIRLGNDDFGINVLGTVSFHPDDGTKLLVKIDPDTVPVNTMAPITAIIDPLRSGPGSGLPAASFGTRYLLLDAIGADINDDGADAWKSTSGEDFVASQYDIVEYDGNQWNVVFNAINNKDEVHYVTNLTTGLQFKWDGEAWKKSFEGLYKAGEWSLIL